MTTALRNEYGTATEKEMGLDCCTAPVLTQLFSTCSALQSLVTAYSGVIILSNLISRNQCLTSPPCSKIPLL